MRSLLDSLSRLNLLLTFVVLLAAHFLLYYSLGTGNWFAVALVAASVDTAVLGILQLVLRSTRAR